MRPPNQCACLLVRKLWPHRAFASIVACFVCIFLATSLAGIVFHGYVIWIANGILLSYLLLTPRRRWPLFLAAAFAGHALGAAAIHASWQVNILTTPLDTAAPFFSALLLRRRSAQLPQFTKKAYVFRFFFLAVLAVPFATALLSAALQTLWFHTSFFSMLCQWSTSDSLGTCIGTPACVAVFRARMRRSLCSPRQWLNLLPVAVVALIVLSQAKAPLSFLLYPLLVLVLLRLGLGWAALCTLFIASIGSWFTVHRMGPFALMGSVSSLSPEIIFQLFLASIMFLLYSISVVLEDLRTTERNLQQIAALHQLVMENSRDVIVIADFDGNRSFVSASGDRFGGWNKEELRSLKGLDLVHPDERPRFATFVQEMRSGKDGGLVECRIRRRDQSYFWVEASLRTIRDPRTGVPTGILNSVREITARKSAEQQLAEAYHTVETMAITDALTGLANRRRFDQCIATEWRRGLRDRKPLSLLLIDIDYFKSYNDTYGHLQGDRCLKLLAEAAQHVIARPGDLLARFGGEEFAIILPSTTSKGAHQIGDAIRAAIQDLELDHSSNTTGVVTTSVGCATLVPQLGQSSIMLMECADQALYLAKRTGRNRVCTFDAQEGHSFAGPQSSFTIETKSA